MQNKPRNMSIGLIALICLILLLQTTSAYVYPGPREKIYALSEWNLLFYIASLAPIGLIASITMKGDPNRTLGNVLGGITLFLSTIFGYSSHSLD